MMFRIFLVVSLAILALIPAVPAFAGDDDELRAVPFAFVGAAGDCDTGYPAGSNIVTAAWLRGMGLPDNGGQNSNPVDPRDNPNKNDPHFGFLMSKNGPTADCSASGAEIKGFERLRQGTTSATAIVLGFDTVMAATAGPALPVSTSWRGRQRAPTRFTSLAAAPTIHPQARRRIQLSGRAYGSIPPM